MPATMAYGHGLWSVTKPRSGCSSDEVTWKASVISPTCVKSKRYASFRSGYIAGIMDVIRSLRRCAPLSARRIGRRGRWVALASMVMARPLDHRGGSHVNLRGCITHPGSLHPPRQNEYFCDARRPIATACRGRAWARKRRWTFFSWRDEPPRPPVATGGDHPRSPPTPALQLRRATRVRSASPSRRDHQGWTTAEEGAPKLAKGEQPWRLRKRHGEARAASSPPPERLAICRRRARRVG